MLGAQIKGLQLQTLAPDLFNTWALQMPLGVWICRAQGFERVGWLVGWKFKGEQKIAAFTNWENQHGRLGEELEYVPFFFRGSIGKSAKLEIHWNLQFLQVPKF